MGCNGAQKRPGLTKSGTVPAAYVNDVFGALTGYNINLTTKRLPAFGVARLLSLLEDFMLHALDVLSVIIALVFFVVSTGGMAGFALVTKGGRQRSDGSEPFI